MPTGKVKWFDPKRRYGFIVPDEGDKDLFVHANAIPGQQNLEENQRVEFDIDQSPKGPTAANVRPVS